MATKHHFLFLHRPRRFANSIYKAHQKSSHLPCCTKGGASPSGKVATFRFGSWHYRSQFGESARNEPRRVRAFHIPLVGTLNGYCAKAPLRHETIYAPRWGISSLFWNFILEKLLIITRKVRGTTFYLIVVVFACVDTSRNQVLSTGATCDPCDSGYHGTTDFPKVIRIASSTQSPCVGAFTRTQSSGPMANAAYLPHELR